MKENQGYNSCEVSKQTADIHRFTYPSFLPGPVDLAIHHMVSAWLNHSILA